MSQTTELRTWLTQAYALLAPVSENPVLEAQLLAAHVLNQPRTWVVTHLESRLDSSQYEQLENLLQRLLEQEPLPYILEKAEFYGLTFQVSPSVLIPRPETELLVETALKWLQAHGQRRQAVDVGTGSGAIAVSLAVHVPDLQVLAVDRSAAVLAAARKNVAQHQVSEQVSLVQADLLYGIQGPFDLVCANLPYIPTQKLAGLDVTRYEPRLALDGGDDGLRLIEPLLADIVSKLAPGGLALFEIEAGQGAASLALASTYFPEGEIEVRQDWAGHDRLLVIERDSGSA
jgi:release factor glutamine methyltransferase